MSRPGQNKNFIFMWQEPLVMSKVWPTPPPITASSSICLTCQNSACSPQSPVHGKWAGRSRLALATINLDLAYEQVSDQDIGL